VSTQRPGGARPSGRPPRQTSARTRRLSTDRDRYVDGDRIVELDDDGPVLPESTVDDTDAGWGERPSVDDDWLRDQRPPHWD
jgi:hypothetical protein